MVELQDRRDKLKILLSSQQHSIENMLKAADMVIEMSLLNHNTFITKEIKALLRADMLIKQELYAMVEQVMAERKSGHLLLS